MAQHIQDDGFHEIQLNGKQLVFLFMAATVVSVVIFLCGVLVGRGVRAERGGAATETASLTGVPAPDAAVQPAAAGAPAATPAGSDPTTAPPPPEVDDLSYFNRLEKQNAPAENLKPASEKPAAASAEKPGSAARAPAESRAAAAAPAPPPAPKEPVKDAPKMVQPAPPVDGGFALQIAALRERGEAEAIAKRLSSKGYSAYVLSPATGTPSVFRVRVGTFKTRREAEAVAAKLQKEEQFKPWITR